MITSMNAMVTPMAIRQPVATQGASTPVPPAGALAGGTSGAVSIVSVATGGLAGSVSTVAAPGPVGAPTPASTRPAGATRATERL